MAADDSACAADVAHSTSSDICLQPGRERMAREDRGSFHATPQASPQGNAMPLRKKISRFFKGKKEEEKLTPEEIQYYTELLAQQRERTRTQQAYQTLAAIRNEAAAGTAEGAATTSQAVPGDPPSTDPLNWATNMLGLHFPTDPWSRDSVADALGETGQARALPFSARPDSMATDSEPASALPRPRQFVVMNPDRLTNSTLAETEKEESRREPYYDGDEEDFEADDGDLQTNSFHGRPDTIGDIADLYRYSRKGPPEDGSDQENWPSSSTEGSFYMTEDEAVEPPATVSTRQEMLRRMAERSRWSRENDEGSSRSNEAGPSQEVLGATEWLDDEHVRVELEWLYNDLYESNPALASVIRFIPPSLSEALRRGEGSHNTILGQIAPLAPGDPPAQYLFLPVNNAGSEAQEGTHWSLLFVDMRDPARVSYIHYDSGQVPGRGGQTAGLNDAPAIQLANRFSQALPGAGRRLLRGAMARQGNDYDCGVFMLEAIRELTQRMRDGELGNGQEPPDLSAVEADREALNQRLATMRDHQAGG